MFGVGVGIRVGGRTAVSSGGGYDPDAQAFFDRVTTAGGTLSTTEKSAVNQLVLDMKSAGIWTSMKAVYPMVGASAAACAQNLVSSSFTGTFSSGWTFASTGVTPNGTSAYMDTGFVPSANLTATSQSSSIYSRTNTSGLGATVDLSSVSAGGNFSLTADLNYVGIHGFVRYGQITDVRNTSTQRYDGYFVGSRTANNVLKLWRSNVQLDGTQGTLDSGISTVSPTLGAENINGIISNYSNKQYAFAHMGDGLTDTQASNFYTAVQGFNTTLNRYVGAPWYNNGNLLLDNYPSAAAAYSVRKLRNNYIGGPIRVRRSSDNAEQDIYFDANGNLDTAQLTSFCGAGNGFVTTWYDQSGNGYNATQSTASNQPQIVSSGSVINLNSKPTVQFTKSQNQNLINGSISISGATTFTWVGSVTLPVSNWSYVFGFGTYSPITGYQYTPNTYVTTNDWQANDLALVGNGYATGQSPRFISNGSQYTSGTQALTLGILSSSNAKVYKNNSLVSQRVGLTGNVGANTGLYIATNNFNEALPGNIQELIFWNIDQNSNVSGINTNTNNFYSIY